MKGNDVAILVLEEPVDLTKNVEIAHLPTSDETCPREKNLVVSGWGDTIIWDGQYHTVRRNNYFLWAVKQQCFDIDKCDAYSGEKEAALCVGDLNEPRNSAYHGDSGGTYLLKIKEI